MSRPCRAGSRRASGDRLALVLGRDGEPVSVGYERPRTPVDSGYTVVLSGAPPAGELDAALDADPGLARWECVCCLQAAYPGLSVGLATARSRGAADRIGDAWVGRRAYEQPLV